MQKSQFIRLKPASSQISELLIMKSYFEHLSNKKHFFKNHYWENPQNPFKNLQNKKDKGNISFVFYNNAKRTHWNQWLSAPFGKKLVFLAVVGFCYQCFENPFGYLLIRFFRGSSRYFQSNWQSLDSQGSYSGLKYCPICTESCCIFAICGSVRGFIVSEVFWGAWIVSMAISACLRLLLLKLEWKPCDCPPFLCCS